MFNILRQIEQWLHQHIFKLGWLLTKDFQITTILYYSVFLPGIIVYEVVYWIFAGILDVRAERAIGIPEKQEIGELRLNFVKLSKKASPWKLAIINIAPTIIGLALIWLIVNNGFDIQSVLRTMSPGTLESVSAGIQQLTNAPDFWLLAFFIFTISNTMLPDKNVLNGWWWLFGVIALATLPLFLLGVGDDIVGEAITGPIANLLNVLSSIFAIIIVIDVFMVAILGTLEAIIERITGNSATFSNGKMLVMARAEAIEQRRQERLKNRTPVLAPGATSSNSSSRPRRTAITTGSPSVYAVAFPIPGPPGTEPITSVSTILDVDEKPALPEVPDRPKRIEPDVIPGQVSSDDKDEETLAESRPAQEPRQLAINPSRTLPEPDEPDEEVETEMADDETNISYEDAEDSA